MEVDGSMEVEVHYENPAAIKKETFVVCDLLE